MYISCQPVIRLVVKQIYSCYCQLQSELGWFKCQSFEGDVGGVIYGLWFEFVNIYDSSLISLLYFEGNLGIFLSCASTHDHRLSRGIHSYWILDPLLAFLCIWIWFHLLLSTQAENFFNLQLRCWTILRERGKNGWVLDCLGIEWSSMLGELVSMWVCGEEEET